MKNRNESNRLVKECIATALIELMKIKDYGAITITDITTKAGVSRMAYYRNYTSKEDILNQYIEEIGVSIHQKILKSNVYVDIETYYCALFEQLGDYRDIGLNAYRAHLGELILKNISKNMALTFPPKEEGGEAGYQQLYLAGAFYNVFIEWIKRGRQETPAEMARICSALTPRDVLQRKGIKS